MTTIQCMVPEIWSTWQTKCFAILDCFLPFYLPNHPKNQNLKKIKKTTGDIILHMCTINDNHIMYGSWDIECDGQNSLSFWTIFCPFTTLTTQKIKILKKWHKWQSYNAWFLRYEAWQTEYFVILDHFLPFYLPNNSKNQTFKKLKKNLGDIIILHKCTKNHDHMLHCFLDTVRNGFDYYFSFWAIFCPFTPLAVPIIKI